MKTIRSRAVQSCYVCGSPGTLIYGELTDSFFSAPGVWSFRKCAKEECGLIWLDPVPLEEDLHLAYEEYYTHGVTQRSVLHGIASTAYGLGTGALLSLLGIPQERRRSQRMFVSERGPGSLLDVGCGSGVLLARMQKRGWKVTGIDVDPAAVETAKQKYGVDAHAGVPADLVAKGRTFDIITSDHVIEHVVDPIDFLRQCRRLLHPGGRLVLKTPNAKSFGLKRYGGAWWGLDPPRHLRIFTVAALRQCAQQAGFTQVSSFTSSANADRIMGASRIIARLGKFEEMAVPRTEKIRSWLVRPILALRARIAWFMDDSSGEEICAVLHAGTPGANP